MISLEAAPPTCRLFRCGAEHAGTASSIVMRAKNETRLTGTTIKADSLFGKNTKTIRGSRPTAGKKVSSCDGSADSRCASPMTILSIRLRKSTNYP